jgi:uncharacterized membrane protein
MSTRNLILAIIAIFFIGWILFKGLATAWVGLKLLPAVGIVFFILVVGWLWGRFTK